MRASLPLALLLCACATPAETPMCEGQDIRVMVLSDSAYLIDCVPSRAPGEIPCGEWPFQDEVCDE